MSFYLIFAISVSVSVSCVFSNEIQSASAGPCDALKCKLPTCFCSDTIIPGGLSRNEIPLIIYPFFDDSVDSLNYYDYVQLFSNRTNPNGDPVSVTFFVSHEYTDYTLVNQLYQQGHEIALHTITHQLTGQQQHILNESIWRGEITDYKLLVSHFANIPAEDLKGFRAPFLQLGGDVMYKVIQDSGIEYDCSRTTNKGLWPYTADYESTQTCSYGPCPKQSYPGLWVIPTMNFHSHRKGFSCAMVDGCVPPPEGVDETFEFMKKNFLRIYKGGKSPMAIPLHSAWFSTYEHKDGYEKFLDYLGTHSDVYVLSISQMLDWIKNPVPLSEMKNWKSKSRSAGARRNQDYECIKQTCNLKNYFFSSCQPCPEEYPWIGNPFGLTADEQARNGQENQNLIRRSATSRV